MIKTTVGVFFGGRSVEHEISVISALQAIAATREGDLGERYEVVPVYITKQGRWLTGEVLADTANYRDMEALERRATEVWMKPAHGARELWRKGFAGERVVAKLDVALPVLHGTNGEDGTFQGFLELIGIPYAGCGVLSSALGMDKVAAKMVLRESGLPVVEYVWFTDREWSSRRDELVARVESSLGYPAIVKPANLGSSVGIARARDREELVRAVETAARYSSRLLVERMIEPLREINCSVLGSADDHRTSVCEEPVRSSEILSYADKYMSGSGSAKGGSSKISASVGGAKIAGGATSEGMASTKRRIPADLPAEVADEIRRLASETFRVLSCDGVARVDFILDGNTIYINEINAIPGSLSFYLWEATGLPFGGLMDALIAGALKRDRDKSHKTVSYSENIFSKGAFSGGKK
ncbi:MAG: D-alanine--D-alanine ligase [Alistipes sp.]|jgi:D-alanine-D-alanine ligase|nr:D-alanine--D-alanine ligase [Alistipes sp.]